MENLQEQKTPDAKLDVSRMQRYFEQFINNRQEYAQLYEHLFNFNYLLNLVYTNFKIPFTYLFPTFIVSLPLY